MYILTCVRVVVCNDLQFKKGLASLGACSTMSEKVSKAVYWLVTAGVWTWASVGATGGDSKPEISRPKNYNYMEHVNIVIGHRGK